MHPVAERARRHLHEALLGEMNFCYADDWPDTDGNPTRIYWLPLTGDEQQRIEAFNDPVSKTLAVVKFRARDEKGELIFSDLSMEALLHQYDYTVMRALAVLIILDADPESTGKPDDEPATTDLDELVDEMSGESDPTR